MILMSKGRRRIGKKVIIVYMAMTLMLLLAVNVQGAATPVIDQRECRIGCID